MRSDAIFIAVTVADEVVDDATLAAKLDEVCPVDIFDGSSGKVVVREENLDECVLCRLCIDASPAGAVDVLKLYDGEASLA